MTNQSTASRWERDELLPGEEHIPQMARFLTLDESEIRALKHNLTPPSVAISQLTNDMLEILDRLEALDNVTAAFEERLRRLEPPEPEGEAPVVTPPKRVRKPKADEFTSEAPEPEPSDVPE